MGTLRRVLGFLTVVGVALVAVGCGGSDDESHGSTAEATRTIDVTMKEFAYEPASVTVKTGETVKFVFRNDGQILHDAFLGDEAAQTQHEQQMREGEKHHGDEAIKVIPGKTGTLTHTFDKPGEALIIGCHETGHYQAGMKMTVTVS